MTTLSLSDIYECEDTDTLINLLQSQDSPLETKTAVLERLGAILWHHKGNVLVKK